MALGWAVRPAHSITWLCAEGLPVLLEPRYSPYTLDILICLNGFFVCEPGFNLIFSEDPVDFLRTTHCVFFPINLQMPLYHILNSYGWLCDSLSC